MHALFISVSISISRCVCWHIVETRFLVCAQVFQELNAASENDKLFESFLTKAIMWKETPAERHIISNDNGLKFNGKCTSSSTFVVRLSISQFSSHLVGLFSSFFPRLVIHPLLFPFLSVFSVGLLILLFLRIVYTVVTVYKMRVRFCAGKVHTY